MLNGHSWQDVIGVFASSEDLEKSANDMISSFPRIAFYDGDRGGVQVLSCSGEAIVGYIPLPRPDFAESGYRMPSNVVRRGA
jgi:hypothetical protein